MVDKLLNLINPLLVNPMCGPSADHDQRLWTQIHGRVLAIPIQPTKGHIRIHNINLGVSVGVWHLANLI
jgi:hypothetical protein